MSTNDKAAGPTGQAPDYPHIDGSRLGEREWAFIRARARGNNNLTAALLAGFDAASAPEHVRRLLSMDVVNQSIAEVRLKRYYADLDVQIASRSPFTNVYYCCTQKSGSQWLRKVFESPAFYRHSGLEVVPFLRLGLRQARIPEAFPEHTIAAHLYVDHETFAAMPKAAPYRAFFILRDPRDVVVSWYYAARYSQPLAGPIPEMRSRLRQLDFEHGLKYIIDVNADWGTFDAQRSWLNALNEQADFRMFRFEQLATDTAGFLAELFDFLAVELFAEEFRLLVAEYAFKHFADGRQPGEENPRSHYRIGAPGAWRNAFTDGLMDYFLERTGDLLSLSGYGT